MTVIYILSSGHAGSTLLGLLLGSHSRIFSLGEVHTINDEKIMCTCGNHPREGVFWKDFTHKLPDHSIKIHKPKTYFLLNKNTPYYMETGELVDMDTYRKMYKSIYRYALEKSGKSVVVSSASPERVEVLAQDPEINPVIVHLVRDGRAVTWSYMKKYGKPFRAMLRWAGANMKIEILKRRLWKEKIVYITYEELAEHPERTLQKILVGAGLPFESSMLRFRDYEHHQIGGNRMRFGELNEIRKDIAWRKEMPRLAKLAFNVPFGWLNMYYMRK